MSASDKSLSILVAGGAGYLGSIISAQLVDQGHRVTVLDSLVSGHREAVHPDAAFIEGAIEDGPLVRSVCERGIDVVMHFAAFIEVGESVIDPAKYYTNNLVNTIAFLNALRGAGVSRLVFSSTAAVYGEPERIPLDEEAALIPVNPYGATKLAVEGVLRDYGAAYDFRSVVFRYFNAGGAVGEYGEDHHPESHLIPLILNAVLSGRELKVFGDTYPTRDGSCIRDYIHVRDLADAHIRAAGHLARGGASDVFNLGTGTGFTVHEVIAAVERITKKRVPYIIVDPRPGDSAVLVATSRKARETLGWSPSSSSLDAIIASTWEWKQRHPAGYGD